MKQLATRIVPTLVVAVFSGCGGTGGGPNEDDIRDPTEMAVTVAYTTVNSTIDETLDFLGPNPGPQNLNAAKGYANEAMEYFEEFAADERLNQEIYGPVLEMWKEVVAAEDPNKMLAALRQLRTHMRKFPPPPPMQFPAQAQ